MVTHSDCRNETFEQGHQSKMVWGGFCEALKSDLVMVPGKERLDSVTYVVSVRYTHSAKHCASGYVLSFPFVCYLVSIYLFL